MKEFVMQFPCAIIQSATETGDVVLSVGKTASMFQTTESFGSRRLALKRAQRHMSPSLEHVGTRSFSAGLVLCGRGKDSMYDDDETFIKHVKQHAYYHPINVIWFVYREPSDSIVPNLDDGSILTREEWEQLNEHVLRFFEAHSAEGIVEHNEQCRQQFEQQRISPKIKEPPKRKRVAGFVYLIRSEQNHYKIGKAKSLKQRLSAFAVTLPFAVELVHSFASNDYSLAEATLHEHFASKRGRGEWFNLDPEDVEWICSLTDGSLDETE